jgi:hypothetical protein
MCALGNKVDFVEHLRYLTLVQLISNSLIMFVLLWLVWPTTASNILSTYSQQIDTREVGAGTGRMDDGL